MSATVVEELRRVWGGVRVDDVRAVDRVLRPGTSRGAVEVASYVFASDPSLRRVAAGRRGLPGASGLLLAGRARRLCFLFRFSRSADICVCF